jgi:hypothetical protein
LRAIVAHAVVANPVALPLYFLLIWVTKKKGEREGLSRSLEVGLHSASPFRPL